MIVPMERIRIVGTQSVLDDSIIIIQQSGCIHIINSQNDKFISVSGLDMGIFQKEVSEKLYKVESVLFDVKNALTIVMKTHIVYKDDAQMPQGKNDWLEKEDYTELESVIKQIQDVDSSIRSLRDELTEIRQYRHMFEEFQPLIEQMESLHEVEINGIFFRGKDSETEENIKIFEKSLSSVTNGAYSIFLGESKEYGIPCLTVHPVSAREAVEKKVFEQYRSKIQHIHIPQRFEQRTYASTLLYLFRREKDAEHELTLCHEKLQSYAVRWMAMLQSANQGLSYAVSRLRVHKYLALSKKTFWISGWIPTYEIPALQTQLDKEFKGKVLLYTTSPSLNEFDEVPVLLKNAFWVKPFERLLSFFPLPTYGTIDPTCLIMIFFPLFFGLMLGDIGYALIIGIIAWLIGWRKRGDIFWKDINIIIATCVISTGLFGILYGECFGKLWNNIGLPHPIFDRKDEIIHLLTAVLFLGGIHLSIGNIAGLRLSIAKGYIHHAVSHFSNIVIVASIVWIFASSMLGFSFKPGLLILLAGFLIKIFSGKLIDLLETVRLFTNILSYARLMAIGIASVILADLADDIFLFSGGMVVGLIASFAIHSLNLILGIFSPTIQAIRLHYVEFFSQFYQPGVVQFSPLTQRNEI